MTLAMMLALTTTAHAASYQHGDVGSFGLFETWNYNGVNGSFNESLDEYSTRFTVVDGVTVDRAWQRFIGATNATVRVGLMADDGAGNPTGTYLTSTTVVNPGSAVTQVLFPSVALSAGTYHLVTQVDTLGSNFLIYGSTGQNDIRPYDKVSDDALASMFRNNGGTWTTVAGRDPFFGLGDATGPSTKVMQQVYSTALTTSLNTFSDSGTALGQRFTITEGEAPAGAVIRVDTLHMSFLTSGSPTDPLLVRLRRNDGTILATMTVQPEQADGSALELTFDPVFIQQGEQYLLTTEFGGSGGAPNQTYRLPSALVSVPGGGAVGWGGATFASVIRSGSSNDWSTWSDTIPTQDMRFRLTGIVYTPEPAAAALLGTALLVWLPRRRMKARR